MKRRTVEGKSPGRAYTERNIMRIIHAVGEEPQDAKHISNKINSNKERGYAGRDFDVQATANVLRWICARSSYGVFRRQESGRYFYWKVSQDENGVELDD